MFLDFTPFDSGLDDDFKDRHYIGVHTLAKLDKKGKDFKLSWLSEKVLTDLVEQKKIRINHEKIGLDRDEILLTASSEELQKFIAKYIELAEESEWEGTDLTLKRIK